MNKIKVEMNLLPHVLTEVIPGLSMHSELGEMVKITIEVAPVERAAEREINIEVDRSSVRGPAAFDSSEKPTES